MAIISVVNRKGGSGKSTTALILGVTLAHQGAKVCLIDCDPNQPLVDWYGDGEGRGVSVVGNMVDSKIVGTIDQLAKTHDAVIVDVEGVAASVMASRAIGRSELVLIPMAPTSLDAREALRTIHMIRDEAEACRRAIPYRVVLTRTGVAVITRDQIDLMEEMAKVGILRLDTQLHKRVAYPAMFRRKKTLAGLPSSVTGLPAARENADQFTREVRAVIESTRKAQAA